MQISFGTISFWKLQWILHFDQSFKINEAAFQANSNIEGGFGDIDTIKLMFLENSPFVLILTLFVTILHLFFDILAFKNGTDAISFNIDIQFWRKKDDLEGLSVRTILMNAFSQFIIMLYLIDQGASWIIVASTIVGVLIEVWKIFQAISIRFAPHFPWIRILDNASYIKSKTKEYDNLAMKYIGLIAIPLLASYSVYSFFSGKQKSMYSYILSALVGFVYAFGTSLL